MILAPRFVYIHLPKTGGTFVETAIGQLLTERGEAFIDTSTAEGKRALDAHDQHQTINEIPVGHRAKPVLFTLRNPFDHYVSFFEFGWWKTHPGDTFDEQRIRQYFPHFPAISFAEYITAIFDPELLHPEYLPGCYSQAHRDRGIGPLTVDYFQFLMPDPGLALQSALKEDAVEQIRARLAAVTMIRCEHLNEELIAFLSSVGYQEQETRFIRRMSRIYPAGGKRRDPRRSWRDYYSANLKALVKQNERFLFELFPEYLE